MIQPFYKSCMSYVGMSGSMVGATKTLNPTSHWAYKLEPLGGQWESPFGGII